MARFCLLLLCLLACMRSTRPSASVPGARALPAAYRKPAKSSSFRSSETGTLPLGNDGRRMQDQTQASGWLKSLQDRPGVVVLIDCNNVRGQTKFAISQEELSDMAEAWAKAQKVTCLMVYDHGVDMVAWQTSRSTALAFSGPRQTADDLIVETLDFLVTRLNKYVFVATSDGGLRDRILVRWCIGTESYRGRGGYEIMESDVFARLIMDSSLVIRVARPDQELQHLESRKERRKDANLFSQSLLNGPKNLLDDAEKELEREGEGSLACRYVRWLRREARVYMNLR